MSHLTFDFDSLVGLRSAVAQRGRSGRLRAQPSFTWLLASFLGLAQWLPAQIGPHQKPIAAEGRLSPSLHFVSLPCDPGNVFWIDTLGAHLWSAELDGSNPQIIHTFGSTSNPSGGEAIAVDRVTGSVYFGDNSTHPGKVISTNTSGANPSIVAVCPMVGGVGGAVGDLAVASDANGGPATVYWCDIGAGIIYHSVVGSGFASPVLTVSHLGGLALDLRPAAQKLYYFDTAGVVYRANLDGSGAGSFCSCPGVQGIALDTCSDLIYFIGTTTPHPGVPTAYIAYANLTDGSNLTTILSGDSTVGSFWGNLQLPYLVLDLHNERMYWTAIDPVTSHGQLRSADLVTGANLATLATGSTNGGFRGVAVCLADDSCADGPNTSVNKDFRNATGKAADGVEWLIQGVHPHVLAHYDGPYPGAANSTFSTFKVVPAGGNTLLRWTGGASIPAGGSAHVGFTIHGSPLVTLGVSWIIRGAPAGCIYQVSIGRDYSHATGTVVFKNAATSCVAKRLFVGALRVEWFAEAVPLAALNGHSPRRPLAVAEVPGGPVSLAPKGSAEVKIPAPPAGARFGLLRYAVGPDAKLTGPNLTVDFAEFAVAPVKPPPKSGK